MPVLVRAGAVIATQPYAPFTRPGPPTLMLTAYPGARGSLRLYDDQGTGFGYTHARATRTRITHTEHGGRSTVTIGAARGHFPGALRRRTWVVRLVGIRRPSAVEIDGRRVRGFTWSGGTLTVTTGPRATDRALTITAR